MAPTAVRELVESHGHKGLVSERPIQIEAFCNLGLAGTQLTLQHKRDAARITFADRVGDHSSTLDNAICTRLVTRLDFVDVKPLDARMCRHTAHFTNHDHPELAVFPGDRTHGETQACPRMPHHQARAVAHAPQSLGDKCRNVLLELGVIHGRDRDVPVPIDC